MAVVYFTVCAVFAQTVAAPPAFDVASVKRIVGPSGGIKHETRPDSLSLLGVTLGYCIRWAYGLGPYQTYLTLGPEWIDPVHESKRAPVEVLVIDHVEKEPTAN
jgi:hypothetical protein